MVKVTDLVIGDKIYLCNQIVEVLMIYNYSKSRQVRVRWMRDGAVSVHMLKNTREYRRK